MNTKGRRVTIIAGLFTLVVLSIAASLSYPHLRFWYRFESLGRNARGLSEYRHRQTGIVMVRLPGGEFFMGAQKADPNGRNVERSIRSARIEDEGQRQEFCPEQFG